MTVFKGFSWTHLNWSSQPSEVGRAREDNRVFPYLTEGKLRLLKVKWVTWLKVTKQVTPGVQNLSFLISNPLYKIIRVLVWLKTLSPRDPKWFGPGHRVRIQTQVLVTPNPKLLPVPHAAEYKGKYFRSSVPPPSPILKLLTCFELRSLLYEGTFYPLIWLQDGEQFHLAPIKQSKEYEGSNQYTYTYLMPQCRLMRQHNITENTPLKEPDLPRRVTSTDIFRAL